MDNLAVDQRELRDTSKEPHSRAVMDFQILVSQALKTLRGLGSDFASHADRLTFLRERLEEGRLHLAVLGQFKRGKSTLLNAFLGQALLPTSVVPLTAIPTFIYYGPELRMQVLYQDERPPKEYANLSFEELSRTLEGLVTEEGNPRNHLGVLQVEIYHPAEILKHGVVLIDTPGIGSTFTHNTEATLNFLPQCDAALFVLSADPPLTEVEADFLKRVKSCVTRLFFIFNKIDYLNAEELETAVDFFKRMLREKLETQDDHHTFCVSARRALDAKLSNDSREWQQSGLAAVEHQLMNFLLSEKTAALCDALGKKVRDILQDSVMRLRLAIESMKMPLADLERRLEIFAKEVKNAERERVIAQDLLVGDRKRSLQLLEERAEELRQRSACHLEDVVAACFSAMQEGDVTEEAILDALAEEVTRFFQTSAGDISTEFGHYVSEILRPHQRRADEIIELIRKVAAELFEIPYHAPESSEAFEIRRKPHWVLRKRVPTLPIVVPEETFDKLLPSSIRISRLKKRLSRQIQTLVRHNVENLRWATLQNLNDAFHRFGLTLDQRFEETIAATHGAIQAGYRKRKEHAEAIADEVAEMEASAQQLADLSNQLHGAL